MAKKRKTPSKRTGEQENALIKNPKELKGKDKFSYSEKENLQRIIDSQEKSKIEDEKVELAKKFNISLIRPKQSKRITALYELFKNYQSKSQPIYYLYESLIHAAGELKDIYQRQLVELKKLDQSTENFDFIKTRVSYIINKYRNKIDELNKKIKHNKVLLQEYEKSKLDWSEVTPELRDELNEIHDTSWNNFTKTFEINKELRNSIIGYENRLCTFKVGKLFLDYKLYVKQELERYKNDLVQLNQENQHEYNEVLRHFNLPLDKLNNFKYFVKRKIESKLEDAEELKKSLGSFYDYDIQQIDRMVEEIKVRQDKEWVKLIQVINHYKKVLLRRQTKSINDVNYLVNYIQKQFEEKSAFLFERLEEYQIINKEKTTFTEDQKQLLLDLNRKELQFRIEKLKHSYTNKIKPLTDDFDNMAKLVDRDYVFDRATMTEKMTELKSLENENVEYFKTNFDKEKNNLINLFDRKYKLIEDHIKFTSNEFDAKVSELKNYVYALCELVVLRNNRAWTQANVEFNAQAKRYLSKFHYETSPWGHLWKNGHRGWMHDYLIINLSSEYLFKVGQSLKNFSPEYHLYTNISKALTQFNEKSREIYKNRDEIEYEQLLRLNSVPKIPSQELKNTFDNLLDQAKQTQNHFKKTLSAFQSKFNKK